MQNINLSDIKNYQNENNRKLILIIRDGWGSGVAHEKNAVQNANTPCHDFLIKNCPTIMLKTDSEAVGLPANTMGNSEVGHATIGMGRVLYQPFVNINNLIKTGEFFQNESLKTAVDFIQKSDGNVHIAGILQEEGVHGHVDHILALVQFFHINLPEKKINLHIFTDGRDSVKDSSLKMLEKLQKKIEKITKNYIFATISGRYYAMDRDNRWERTKQSYDVILNLAGENYQNAYDLIEKSHKSGIFDEFISPVKHENYQGLKDNDLFVFANFRTDRPRQLTRALVEENFTSFERINYFKNLFFVAMTEFYSGLENEKTNIIIPNINLENSLGQVVSEAGLSQLRISETEKYPHVTFFLNGQKETPFVGQINKMIPSPKVATYDLKPEMSAEKIAEELIKQVKQKQFDLVVVNLVNADMVGHTGDYDASVLACQAVDEAVEKIIKNTQDLAYNYMVLADHGNSEEEYGIHTTTHTLNLVWCSFLLNENLQGKFKLKEKPSTLQDVAPTALKILGLKQPIEMTGQSLLN